MLIVSAGFAPVLGCGHASSGHLDGLRIPTSASGLDGGLLQGRGSQGDSLTTGQEYLKDLGVKEALHRLAVDVSDQIARSETGIKGWRAPIHFHHQVVHGVKVRVAKVNSNGANSEPEPSGSAPNNDGRLK